MSNIQAAQLAQATQIVTNAQLDLQQKMSEEHKQLEAQRERAKTVGASHEAATSGHEKKHVAGLTAQPYDRDQMGMKAAIMVFYDQMNANMSTMAAGTAKIVQETNESNNLDAQYNTLNEQAANLDSSPPMKCDDLFSAWTDVKKFFGGSSTSSLDTAKEGEISIGIQTNLTSLNNQISVNQQQLTNSIQTGVTDPTQNNVILAGEGQQLVQLQNHFAKV